MDYKKFQKIIFFPSVYWSHNWERQHELIYRLSNHINDNVYLIQPLGLINYKASDIVKRIFHKLKERSGFLAHENPKTDNMCFVELNFIPFHFYTLLDWLNNILLRVKLNINPQDKLFLWFTYVNGFSFKLISENSFTVIDLATRRQISDTLSNKAKQTEKKAIAKANIVFVDNYNTYLDYKNLNKHIFYLPQGVGQEMFKRPLQVDELSDIKDKKIIGYCGALHSSINYDLLFEVIESLPDYLFIFVGNIIDEKAKNLTNYKNVLLTGRKKKSELVNYYHIFDIGLIPYKITPFTSGVFPTKFFEYAACGVPIISSALPDLLRYNKPFLKIYSDKNELISSIENLIESKGKYNKELVTFAKDNTWEKRFKFILNKIDLVK